MMLCRASHRVRPHLKRLGVATLKPPFRSGLGTTAKPKAAPAPASHSAKPVSSQTKFVNALLHLTPPPSHASPSRSQLGVGARRGKQRQTSQSVNGAISDFYLFNWIARPPTVQPNPPCTLHFLLHNTKAHNVADSGRWLWRSSGHIASLQRLSDGPASTCCFNKANHSEE